MTVIDRMPQETVLDRMIRRLAPRAGVRRLRARAVNYLWSRTGGGYDSGRSESKELQEWQPDIDSAVTALHPELYQMRARSRDSTRNNALAGGALGISCRSVVGTGLKPQPMADQDVLGLTDEAAEEWNEQARRHFEAWACADGGCDIAQTYSFEELQELVFRGVWEGGDVLVLDRWLPDRGCGHGTCVQLIEAEQVCNPNWDGDTDRLAGGVEVDVGTGRVEAYHVVKGHPGEGTFDYEWTRLPAWNDVGERVARLVFRPARVGERRGVPWLAAILKPLKQLDRLTNAELMAAVLQSYFTVFVYNEHPDSHPLGDMGQGGIFGDDGPETGMGREYEEPGDLRLGHGLVTTLGPGERIAMADPQRPNSEYGPFVEHLWQTIGIGLGIPYEVWTMRFQSSYSASKGALAEAAKTFRTARSWMIRQFCQPQYERVIEEAVATGALTAPGFYDDVLTRRAWLRATWMGDAVPSIDPEKEVKAATERVTLGVSTLDRESREMTGTTFKENVAQRLKEEQAMAEVRELMNPMPEPEEGGGESKPSPKPKTGGDK